MLLLSVGGCAAKTVIGVLCLALSPRSILNEGVTCGLYPPFSQHTPFLCPVSSPTYALRSPGIRGLNKEGVRRHRLGWRGEELCGPCLIRRVVNVSEWLICRGAQGYPWATFIQSLSSLAHTSPDFWKIKKRKYEYNACK